MKQLKLIFRGHPAFDSRFKKYDVWLAVKNQKDLFFVKGIWAQHKTQAIVKAAKKIKKKNYDIERSLAKQKP